MGRAILFAKVTVTSLVAGSFSLAKRCGWLDFRRQNPSEDKSTITTLEQTNEQLTTTNEQLTTQIDFIRGQVREA